MKNNLFIIGNGFDRGHDMPTSYNNFKDWLIEMYPESQDTENFMVSDAALMSKGEMSISDEDLAAFLVYCINETAGGNWANFEDSLGRIDWELFFDDVFDVIDREGDIDLWKTAYAREDFTSTLCFNAYGFSRLFSQWINTISYPKGISCKKFLTDSLKDSSLFLTFNYTKTLEDIYHIPPEQICHIHGVQGKDIIIGHGVEKSHAAPVAYSDDEYDYESDYDFGMEGIDDIHDSLRKPTKQILEQTPFFAGLKHHRITDIFSWGFSFSAVDLCYIQELCKTVNTGDMIWHLHDWGNEDPVRFEQLLRQCGFSGKVTTFQA